jgi:hypothetical protein
MRPLALTVMLLAALGRAVPAHAHGLSTSYTEIAVTPARLELVCLLSADEILLHFPIHARTERRPGPEEIEAALTAVFAFLEQRLVVAVDGERRALQRGAHRIHPSATFVRLELSAPLQRAPAEITIAADPLFFERFGPQHVNLVKVSAAEGRIQQSALTADRSKASFVVGYTSLLAQCTAFVRIGIGHIFHGYDHLLFLVALVVVAGRLGQLVSIVTAFTVGHSVTLILAALQVVSLPSRVVEGGIALTIAYVAFDNFFVTATSHRWWLTCGFGLVHGFGFANVLRELALPRGGAIASLLSFNVGVEIGQVAVAAVLFPLTLWLSRQRFRRPVVLAVSGVIFLAGVAWFFQRAFDLDFMPG